MCSSVARLQAVIFDYYGTLAEFAQPRRERVFDDLARRVGIDLPPGEAFRHYRELTTKDWQLRLGGQQRPSLDGTPPPFVAFRAVWLKRTAELFRQWDVDAPAELGADAYADAHAEAAVYPDVPPALEALRERYRLAVLSDADSGFLASSVERSGLAFETVVSSEALHAYKPHISMFRAVCDRLGVEPSAAAYVGDSPWADIAGARHARMRAVWIHRHDAVWPDDIERPPSAVGSLAELPELLAAS